MRGRIPMTVRKLEALAFGDGVGERGRQVDPQVAASGRHRRCLEPGRQHAGQHETRSIAARGIGHLRNQGVHQSPIRRRRRFHGRPRSVEPAVAGAAQRAPEEEGSFQLGAALAGSGHLESAPDEVKERLGATVARAGANLGEVVLAKRVDHPARRQGRHLALERQQRLIGAVPGHAEVRDRQTESGAESFAEALFGLYAPSERQRVACEDQPARSIGACRGCGRHAQPTAIGHHCDVEVGTVVARSPIRGHPPAQRFVVDERHG